MSRVTADPLLTLPVRSFIGSPADCPPGLLTDQLALPLRQTAFIELHCWNVGLPEGPAYPMAFSLGMGSPEGTVLAGQIITERIKPALEAARAARLAVFHVQSENIARKHRQSRDRLEPRTKGLVLPAAALPGYNLARADRVHGPGYRDWIG